MSRLLRQHRRCSGRIPTQGPTAFQHDLGGRKVSAHRGCRRGDSRRRRVEGTWPASTVGHRLPAGRVLQEPRSRRSERCGCSDDELLVLPRVRRIPGLDESEPARRTRPDFGRGPRNRQIRSASLLRAQYRRIDQRAAGPGRRAARARWDLARLPRPDRSNGQGARKARGDAEGRHTCRRDRDVRDARNRCLGRRHAQGGRRVRAGRRPRGVFAGSEKPAL